MELGCRRSSGREGGGCSCHVYVCVGVCGVWEREVEGLERVGGGVRGGEEGGGGGGGGEGQGVAQRLCFFFGFILMMILIC